MAGSFFAGAATENGNNDDIPTAQKIAFSETVTGGILTEDDTDFYKITLPSPGRIDLRFTSYMKYYSVYIYTPDATEIWKTENNELNEKAGVRTDNHIIYLEKGDYYIEVMGKSYSGSWYWSTGEYSFSAAYKSSGTTCAEPNNSFAQASTIKMYNNVVGQISQDDDYDIYMLDMAQSGTVNLRFTSYMKYYCVYIYNPDAKEIWKTENNELDDKANVRTDNHEVYLAKGKYFIEVMGKSYDGSWYAYYGKYSFAFSQKLKAPAGVKASVTTNSASLKWNPVSGADGYTIYKNGKAISSVTGKSYRAAGLKPGRKYTFTVCAYKTVNKVKYFGKTTEKIVYTKPGAPKIKSAKRITRRGIFGNYYYLKLKWKKVSGASGYLVKYASNKKLKRAVSAEVYGQKGSADFSIQSKGKAKYVKIRAYKTLDGNKVYGNYSKVFKAR